MDHHEAAVDPEFLFAEDLVHFVMQGYDLPFSRTPTFMRTAPVRFVPCVGHVVRHLASLQEDKILVAFDYLRCIILSGDHFDELARFMASAHFDNGEEFLLLNFLYFCAQITRLAVLFYSNNVSDAPLKTVSVVRRALRQERLRFVSSGGWDKLYDLCFFVLHRIPRRQRCKAPAKTPFATASVPEISQHATAAQIEVLDNGQRLLKTESQDSNYHSFKSVV